MLSSFNIVHKPFNFRYSNKRLIRLTEQELSTLRQGAM